MSDKPIIFSAPMILALLDGRKTQTRRVLNPQPQGDVIHYGWSTDADGAFWTEQSFASHRLHIWAGDRLWVREAWRIAGAGSRVSAEACRRHRAIEYRADGYQPIRHEERSPIHMPRWASRMTLLVTEVRVQRLQDISRQDAIAEGLTLASNAIEEFWRWPAPHNDALWLSPVAAYRSLWDNINAGRDGGAYAWEKNPWVAATTFEAVKANINEMAPPVPYDLASSVIR